MTRAGRLRPYATALAFLASARTPTARAFHSDPTARTGLFTSSCQNAAQFSTWPACLAVTTGAQSQLENALNPAFQESVRNLWFEHVKQDEDLIVPSMEIAKRWFQRDNDFDRVCMYISLNTSYNLRQIHHAYTPLFTGANLAGSWR